MLLILRHVQLCARRALDSPILRRVYYMFDCNKRLLAFNVVLYTLVAGASTAFSIVEFPAAHGRRLPFIIGCP